jgi:hypothetical protein
MGLKDFFKNVGKYLKFIMGLEFKDLLINIFNIVIVVLISLIVYVPLEAIEDFIVVFIRGIAEVSTTFTYWIDVAFKAIEIVLAFLTFVYLFNVRCLVLMDPQKIKNMKSGQKTQASEENIDLPKIKKDEK